MTCFLGPKIYFLLDPVSMVVDSQDQNRVPQKKEHSMSLQCSHGSFDKITWELSCVLVRAPPFDTGVP